jgi:hypothetical protein
MERTDWLHAGFDCAEARFLMLTAITRHSFGSSTWGEAQVRRLYDELTAIDDAAAQIIADNGSVSGDRVRPASGAFGAARLAGNPPASRLRRLFGRLRLSFRRDQSARRISPSIGPANRPAW